MTPKYVTGKEDTKSSGRIMINQTNRIMRCITYAAILIITMLIALAEEITNNHNP